MELKEIQQLINKYLSGKTTEDENAIVERWYENIYGDDPELNPEQTEALKANLYESLFDYIHRNEAEELKPVVARSIPFRIWIAAAAVLLICLMGGLFYVNYSSTKSLKIEDQLANDIQPGGNKATLVLADGSVVVLDDAKNGNLASQGNTAVQKSADGILTYKITNTGAVTDAVTFNTISTPRGGQYNIILPDGSKIWLNAASSLKFPTAFTGKERNVELTGEAYFEITKNAAMPFHVKSAGQTIEVLGTHFDINAYKDEPVIKTTLLEGSVKVTKGTETAMLKPGQQSSLLPYEPGAIQVSNNVDEDEVTAWKNGMFQFNEADIKTVMRQISRWYDVDVEFESKIPSDHFKGKLPRDAKISQVLKIIELSGVNFKIEGKKIIVK